MNYYFRKRVQSGLTKGDMANELGLSYTRYSAIEKGSVKMSSKLINKFNEIINRGKENEIIEIDNKVKANDFWEQVHKKDETGRWELVNKMHEFNIQNYEELVELLGYKSVVTIYNYLQGRNPVGDKFKKRLYNFFSDETNIQIPKQNKKVATYKINNPSRKANPKLDKYYEKTNFKKIMKENGITNVDMAKAIGVHNSTISTAVSKKYKPSYRLIQAIKDYLELAVANETVETPIKDDYISKTKLLGECKKEIAENQAKIDLLEKQINEINAKIALSNKIVDLLNNM